MANITHSCSCKQWLTALPICLKRYISVHENSTYPRKSLESEWGLCLCTVFAKIIQGIWVWLRLALFYHNTMKKKKTPLPAVVWSYTKPSQILWVGNSDWLPPSSGRWTAWNPMHGGPCKRDEAGYFPQFRDLRQLQGCKHVGWKLFQHQSRRMQPLNPPSTTFFVQLWRYVRGMVTGQGLSAVCDTTVWCLWGCQTVAGGRGNW